MIGFEHLRVVHIGGSSHAGKSTLARSLAARFGWSSQSTDKLAKHPGRPWRTAPTSVPPHVAGHYLALSVEELTAEVIRHYRDTVWPLVESAIVSRAVESAGGGLVMEGSALLPELAAAIGHEHIAAVWLTASTELFKQRIYQTSGYETKPPVERKMIDRFVGRTVRYDEWVMSEVGKRGLAHIDVGNFSSEEELLSACLIALGRQRSSLRLGLL